MQRTLTLRTTKRREVLDITRQVTAVVEASKAKEGVCTVFARHATAALIINENADPDVRRELRRFLIETAELPAGPR